MKHVSAATDKPFRCVKLDDNIDDDVVDVLICSIFEAEKQA